MTMQDLVMSPERWQNFWEYYKNEPQQVSGIWMLYDQIKRADPSLLVETAAWVEKYREAPPAPPASSPFPPNAPFSHYVTPHIQYGELSLWQEARRFRSQHQCDTALKLCKFMEEARAHFGSAIIITSGFRPEPINSQVGGAPNSEHTFYATGVGAVDFALERGNQYDLQKWVDANWPESVGYGAPSFVHLGCRGDGQRRRWNY